MKTDICNWRLNKASSRKRKHLLTLDPIDKMHVHAPWVQSFPASLYFSLTRSPSPKAASLRSRSNSSLFSKKDDGRNSLSNLLCILSAKVIAVMLAKTKAAPPATRGFGTVPYKANSTAYAKSNSVLRTMFTMVGVAILLAGIIKRVPVMLAMLVPNTNSQSGSSMDSGAEIRSAK